MANRSPLRAPFLRVVAAASLAGVSSLVGCGGSDSGASPDDASALGDSPCCTNPPGPDTGPYDGGDSGSGDAPADTIAPGSGPTAFGCPVFPADNEWNRDVSGDPVDPNSANYLSTMNATKSLHPDWGAATDLYGIPFIGVPATQAKVPIVFSYADESDPGPYPIPADAPIEGGSAGSGDRHVLAIDRGSCLLYEMFDSRKDPTGAGWTAGSGAVWDLRSNKLRPEGWTSADAAGLPIFPGLARTEEVLDAGEIKHALRFTMNSTQKAYVHPATHQASSKTDPNLPPMGLRVRLRASFDVSTFSPAAQVVLKALKKYGMFVADNGSDWFISGSSEDKWAPVMDSLNADFRKVHGSDFEVVKLGTIVK